MLPYSEKQLSREEIMDSYRQMLAFLDEVDQFLKSRNAMIYGEISIDPPELYGFNVSAKVNISLQIKAYS